jgi:hypothetical protein
MTLTNEQAVDRAIEMVLLNRAFHYAAVAFQSECICIVCTRMRERNNQ